MATDRRSLEEAIQEGHDEKCSFRLKILEIHDEQSYQTKDGKMLKYFTIIGAEKDVKVYIRIYMMQIKKNLRVAASYLVKNAVRKAGDAHFWLPRGGSFERCALVEVQDDCAFPRSNTAQTNELRPVSQALHTNTDSTVHGKVCQVSPIKLRRDGQMKLRFISIFDGSDESPCKVALFGADAETPPPLGTVVQINHVYPWRRRNETNLPTSLATKPATQIEIIQSQHLSNLQPRTLCDDEDFNDVPDDRPPMDFEVLSIQSVAMYQSCPKFGCRNKKVDRVDDKFICPNCQESVVPNVWGNSTLSLKIGEEVKTATVWRQDLIRMFPSLTPEAMAGLKDRNDFEDLLAGDLDLPVTGKMNFSDTDKGIRVERIVVKRKNTDS